MSNDFASNESREAMGKRSNRKLNPSEGQAGRGKREGVYVASSPPPTTAKGLRTRDVIRGQTSPPLRVAKKNSCGAEMGHGGAAGIDVRRRNSGPVGGDDVGRMLTRRLGNIVETKVTSWTMIPVDGRCSRSGLKCSHIASAALDVDLGRCKRCIHRRVDECQQRR